MVQINFAKREINCKLVYYGPGLSGKTTNLEVVHKKAPASKKGELTSIATEGDRTLFFDYMPLELGKVGGMNTKFQLYTVPGQVYYNATRKLVLQGADGVVFVADSQGDKLEENIESFQNLEENLREQGLDPKTIPMVLQWNKRDLPGVMTVDELDKAINKYNAPTFEAVAVTGEGVFPTLKKLAQMVLEKLNKEYGLQEDRKGSAAPAAATATASGPKAAAVKEAPSAPPTGKVATTAARKSEPPKPERRAPAPPPVEDREEEEEEEAPPPPKRSKQPGSDERPTARNKHGSNEKPERKEKERDKGSAQVRDWGVKGAPSEPEKKKRSKLPLVLLLLVVGAAAGFVAGGWMKKLPPQLQPHYDQHVAPYVGYQAGAGGGEQQQPPPGGGDQQPPPGDGQQGVGK